MRMIGSIPQAEDAERFSDYLVTQKIENMVEESASGSWSVWVEHDDDLDRAKVELSTFLHNPADARYDAQTQAKKIRREEEKKSEKRRTNFIDYRTRWGQAKQWAAPVTIVLIALSMVLSIGTNSIALSSRSVNPEGEREQRGLFGPPRFNLINPLLFTSVEGDRWMQWMVRHPEDYKDPRNLTAYWWQHLRAGEVWRLITPIFLHLSILHLLFNMFWLRDLGGAIEIQRGSWVLLSLVIASALLSNVGEYYWTGPAVSAGMSGVVYALFGYIVVKQKYQPHLGLGLQQQTIWIMMAWLFLCMTGFMGSIANAAHVTGLVVGVVYAAVPVAWRRTIR